MYVNDDIQHRYIYVRIGRLYRVTTGPLSFNK